MAQRAQLTLHNGVGEVIFYPFREDANGVIYYQTRTEAIPLAGQMTLSVNTRPVTKTSKTTKVAWKLEIPILRETTEGSGDWKLVGTNVHSSEDVIHELTSDVERASQSGLADALRDADPVVNAVESYDFVW